MFNPVAIRVPTRAEVPTRTRPSSGMSTFAGLNRDAARVERLTNGFRNG